MCTPMHYVHNELCDTILPYCKFYPTSQLVRKWFDFMKTGDIARLLGVSSTTIHNWIERFPDYFTGDSQGKRTKQRNYTDNDVLALATIAKLSADGHSLSEIGERLESGYRVDNPGVSNLGIDPRMIPAAAVEQMMDATEVRFELEHVRADRDRLVSLLESERQLRQNMQERLYILQAEIVKLNREIGRLEGRLDRDTQE